jgi:AraC-like DNA-binding protein
MPSDHVSASGTRDRASEFDALSDVLDLVRLDGALLFIVDASDPWCVNVPPVDDYAAILGAPRGQVISFHVVLEGSGLATVPGYDPVRFEAGDVLVFPKGDAYRMESKVETPPEFDREGMIAFFAALAADELPFIVPEGGGGAPPARFVCGFLTADDVLFDPLLPHLPRLMKVSRAHPERDTLSRLIEAASAEFAFSGPGARALRRSLCRLMLVETLRQHLMNVGAEGAGWLAALDDPVAGAALRLIHENPSERWTLDLLARRAGASRSVLVERFTKKVGRPPMDYLACWRVQLAGKLMDRDRLSVDQAAACVGYGSAQSFSRAFKRLTGLPPPPGAAMPSALRPLAALKTREPPWPPRARFDPGHVGGEDVRTNLPVPAGYVRRLLHDRRHDRRTRPLVGPCWASANQLIEQ